MPSWENSKHEWRRDSHNLDTDSKINICGLRELQFGVLDTVACYNDCNAIKCLAFEKLGINPGTRMVNALKMLEERIHTCLLYTSRCV